MALNSQINSGRQFSPSFPLVAQAGKSVSIVLPLAAALVTQQLKKIFGEGSASAYVDIPANLAVVFFCTKNISQSESARLASLVVPFLEGWVHDGFN